MNAIQIAQAKDNLPQLVDQAEAGQPVRITRRGKPGAVLVSDKLYRQLAQPENEEVADPAKGNFGTLMIDFMETHAEELKELFGNGEDVFANVRDPSPGRPAWTEGLE